MFFVCVWSVEWYLVKANIICGQHPHTRTHTCRLNRSSTTPKEVTSFLLDTVPSIMKRLRALFRFRANAAQSPNEVRPRLAWFSGFICCVCITTGSSTLWPATRTMPKPTSSHTPPPTVVRTLLPLCVWLISVWPQVYDQPSSVQQEASNRVGNIIYN